MVAGVGGISVAREINVVWGSGKAPLSHQCDTLTIYLDSATHNKS